MNRLNLGCSGWIRPASDGWVNVDCRKLPGVDEVCDLNVIPWPWADGSVDEVYASHVLEHLDDPCAAILEIHRILKPGGTVHLIVPHMHGEMAVAFGHKAFFKLHWFRDLSGNPDNQNDGGLVFRCTNERLQLFHHARWLGRRPFMLAFVFLWESFWNCCATARTYWEMLGAVGPSEIHWKATKGG
jgi:SAM-dependent methyltransferase